ncbi:MAG: beta-lactamase family protein [Oscillospiraceae bacterium]|jgi:CubicO group peptidase (beta-lactamase class C family)|nr:beta-lactamase family protein [Oscillospiraceae bacterium]
MSFLRTSPGSGELSAIARFLTAAEAGRHRLHSFMIVKNGSVIFERFWKPYAPNLRHKLYSLSKSFTSVGVGIAIDEGLLRTDTLLSDIFGEEFERLGDRIPERTRRMTIRHLLTMNTGQSYENWAENNIEGFLTAEVEFEPGTAFNYNTLATYMLSAAITRLTGESLAQWLKPRLFEPLGIDAYWETDGETGINLGGVGLNAHTEDLAALGQLLINKGLWNGKRIVSEEYVAAASSNLTPSNHSANSIDWTLGYGYQFWQCQPKGVFRGDGMFGQYIICEPETQTVIAVTGNAEMQSVMELFWTLLAEMKTPKLASAELPPERSLLTVSAAAAPYPDFRAVYEVTPFENAMPRFPLTSLSIDFSAEGECLLLMYAGTAPAVLSLLLNQSGWYYTAATYLPDRFFSSDGGYYGRAYILGEWSGDTFTAKMWFNETPCLDEWKFEFSPGRESVTISYRGFAYNSRFEKVGVGLRISA